MAVLLGYLYSLKIAQTILLGANTFSKYNRHGASPNLFYYPLRQKKA